LGGDRKKIKTGTKEIEQFKKLVVSFYIMNWKRQAYLTHD